jgi:hypothetical protein
LARENGFSVVEAAATACLAANTGDEDLWAEATSRRDDLRDADLNCLEVGVYGLLERLVDAHAADPDLPLTFERANGVGAPPCPTVSGLDPARGRAGDVVTITGKNLEFVTLVIVDFGDGSRTCFEFFENSSPSLAMPEPPEGVTSAQVVVAAHPAQWEMGGAAFEYEQSETTPTDGTETGTADATATVENAAFPADCP